MIPDSYLDDLRRRVSLPQLIGRQVKLTALGGEHQGLCPFHNEKSASFYVVPAKAMWHCFGCGAHGDAVDFVQRYWHVDFLEAVGRLAQYAGLPLPAGHKGADGALEPAPGPAMAAAVKSQAQIDTELQVKREEARAIWLAGAPVAYDDPVWRYLAGRGVDLALFAELHGGRLPSALRFHRHCYHKLFRRFWPAMVAAVSDDSAEGGGAHLSTHCTFLDIRPDGSVRKIEPPNGDPKDARRCYGSYRGGSIKLARGRSRKPWRQAPAGDELVLGEGIEDTMTGALLLPDCRAVAGVSGGNIAKNIQVPRNIRKIILAVQNDRLKAGRKPNEPDWWGQAEARFAAQGFAIGRLQPPIFVQDINEYAQWLRAHPAPVELVEA